MPRPNEISHAKTVRAQRLPEIDDVMAFRRRSGATALAMALALLAACAHGRSVTPPPAPDVAAPPERTASKRPLLLRAAAVGVGGAGIVVGAVPAVRRSVLRLLGREAELDMPPKPPPSAGAAPRDDAGATPRPKPPPPSGEAERFALTPERLATISSLNPRLEEIGDDLAQVPVFTAAVGNGTSPLTVPAEDGRKLAYFFTEHADAEAFLKAVRENTGVELRAQVIGVSLADIIRAYATKEAQDAKETFVLIPTMSEVASARQILREAGRADDPAELGPGSGLVPLFWSELLAMQTAGGKQRKVLFFRRADLLEMYRTLRETQLSQGKTDDLPEAPRIQCSDLQTMAQILVAANKTDDVVFMPSSAAVGRAQGSQAARARSRPAGGGAEGGSEAEENGGGAAAAAVADAAATTDLDEPAGAESEEDEEVVV